MYLNAKVHKVVGMWVLINVFDLFYPKCCLGCGESLSSKQAVLCEFCLLHLDFIPISVAHESEMKRRFYGKLKLTHCTALLYFAEKSITQQLLHQLKYKNQQQIGEFLAVLSQKHLQNHAIISWVDFIVCVPLHPSKEKKRGYNQLDSYCKKLSELWNVPYHKDYLIKATKSRTQTRKNIFQRAKLKSEFIINPKYDDLKNKKILLIDDVMTTGSTLQNAGKCIVNNRSNQLSILTMAYTK